jgi:hypothetical protein
MKNSLRFFVGISLLIMIVCCYSCGVENSEKEMNEAQQAMEKAKAIFAEDLTPSNWEDAMKAWEQGQAAVKEGKPAKTYFLRAKSRFDKAATIAKSRGETLSKDIQAMQVTIDERFSTIKAGLERGKVSSKIQKQIKPTMAELEEGIPAVGTLVGQGNYMKANSMAKDILTKIYNVELIMAGKKPKI